MHMAGQLADRLWHPWLSGLFLIVGLVYSFGSGFFQLFGARVWLRETLGSLLHPRGNKTSALTSVQALATALASTMGTGSIAGVACAITLGGPGAVFWMWVYAFLALMTSCGEKLLAVRYQRPAPDGGFQGGPMFYLRNGAGSPLLSLCFTLACIPATFVGGNLIQASTIAESLHAAFGLDPLRIGLVLLVLTALVMVGGIERIAQVSSMLVPAMSLLYLGCGCAVLFHHAGRLPSALQLIFVCAFRPESALGAGTGLTLQTALRYGASRGIFANEAGLGTSAMAHAAADAPPARQGMWGIFEVFLSSFLVCSISALTILVSGVYSTSERLTGAPLTSAAFSTTLGAIGSCVVTFSLLLFAFSSILGWSYYGEQCLRFLTGSNRFRPFYRVLFLLCILFGCMWETDGLWQLLDLCNGWMALPNLLGLLYLAPEALSLLHQWLSHLPASHAPEYFSKKQKKKGKSA